MSKTLYLRLHVEKGGEPQPVQDPDKQLVFADDDTIRFDFGDCHYTFVRNGSGFATPAGCDRKLSQMIAGALKLGKFCFTGPSASPTNWVVLPYGHVSDLGLCPCGSYSIKSLQLGDMIQLWSGEMFYCKPEGMDYLPRSWVPGLDNTPAQRSRWWEKD